MRFENIRYDESSAELRPWRKRVYHDDSEGAETIIADEKVYSEQTPRVLDGVCLELTPPEVEWLYYTLGDLLDKWGTPKHNEADSQKPTTEREGPPLVSAFDTERQLSLFKDV